MIFKYEFGICGVHMAESLLTGLVFSNIYCLEFRRTNLKK